MTEPARFITRLQSEDLDGDRVGYWRLLTPLVYYSAVLGRHVVMPAGSEANSYSVPAALAFIVWGIDRRPAFIHDHLYGGGEPGVTRAQADAVILEACESVGIGWLRRRVIFRGTRLGGWAYFKRTADDHEVIKPIDPPSGG